MEGLAGGGRASEAMRSWQGGRSPNIHFLVIFVLGFGLFLGFEALDGDFGKIAGQWMRNGLKLCTRLRPQGPQRVSFCQPFCCNLAMNELRN